MAPDDATAAARSFYGRWARLYDAIARGFPAVSGVRRRAAAALALDAGDVAVEMGCGTGANLPYVRDEVVGGEWGDGKSVVGTDESPANAAGRVVGLDFTRPMLARAARRGRREGWTGVDLVQGDATRPPIDSPVDGVLATFVSGMLPDPAAAVEQWVDLVRPGGRVVLVDAARSERPYGPVVNLPFRAFVRLSSPTGGAGHDDPTGALDRRVRAAHDALAERTDVVATEDHLLGFVRLTAGEVPEPLS